MTIHSMFPPIDWSRIENETIVHFRHLLRCDTRNPPGNERKVAEYLRTVLQQEGIISEMIGPSFDRASLVARVHGDGSAPPLLLMSHTDVVAVEREKWTHDPFAAEIADGFIYGRGALDMKHMVTMELMTILLLKRTGVPLKRDVIFLAAADEEAGGQEGAGWIVKHCPELIQAEYALNEGGGIGIEINGKRYYRVQIAEKGAARFQLRTTGDVGHGSIPRENNAVRKLAEALVQFHQTPLPAHFTDALHGYLTGIASAQPPDVAQLFLSVLTDEATADKAIDGLPLESLLKQELRAMIRNTVVPTMLQAGAQINVIPSEATAFCDARLLPGWTLEMFRRELSTLVGEDVAIDFLNPSEPRAVDPASPLFETIKAVLQRHDPAATVIPSLLTAGTDAKHISRLGIKVYGFAPELFLAGGSGLDAWSGIHGHNERIHLQSLQWGTRVLSEVVMQFAHHEEAQA
jgi:acetylornithine deacetylase/succinyl-diaminopimelate desuccinylase-like protein